MKWIAYIVCLICLTAGVGFSSDQVMIIGGGPTPQESQVSIESNVIWIADLIDYPGVATKTMFFASGPERSSDVRYEIEPDDLSLEHRALIRIFGEAEPEFSRYRGHRLGKDVLKADRQTVKTGLESTLKALLPGDTLWIIYSGHGGWADGGRSNTLRLWNEEKLTAGEFADLLALAPKDSAIRFVLPQCHSGGFIDVLIDRLAADGASGMIRSTVCGFASVPSEAISEG